MAFPPHCFLHHSCDGYTAVSWSGKLLEPSTDRNERHHSWELVEEMSSPCLLDNVLSGMIINIILKLTCTILKSSKLMYSSKFSHLFSQDCVCKIIQKHTQITPIFLHFLGMVATRWVNVPSAVRGISYISVAGTRWTTCGETSTAHHKVEFCTMVGNGSCPLFRWTDVARTRHAANTAVKQRATWFHDK